MPWSHYFFIHHRSTDRRFTASFTELPLLRKMKFSDFSTTNKYENSYGQNSIRLLLTSATTIHQQVAKCFGLVTITFNYQNIAVVHWYPGSSHQQSRVQHFPRHHVRFPDIPWSFQFPDLLRISLIFPISKKPSLCQLTKGLLTHTVTCNKNIKTDKTYRPLFDRWHQVV